MKTKSFAIKLLMFCVVSSFFKLNAQNPTLGRITTSSLGVNNRQLSVTMGQPLAGSYVASDGKTIFTVGAQIGNRGNSNDSLELNQYSFNIDSQANLINITLTSNRDWTIANSNTWLITNTLTGNKNFSLQISVSSNKTSTERTGEIIITAGSISKTILITQSPNKTVDIKALAYASDYITVSPNPFSLELNVGSTEFKEGFKYNIINSMGQIIANGNCSNEIQKINTTNLSEGIYSILFYSNTNEILKTIKIIKINNH